MTALITPAERAHRQTSMDHAIASNRLEGLTLPPAALKIMQSYVEGEITYEQEQEQMLALAAAVRMTTPYPKELEKLADKPQELPPK